MTKSTIENSDVLALERMTFESKIDDLIEHHNGKFVVIIKDELQGVFDSFDAAAGFAKTKFGRGPYLIRQVGTPPSMTMPASVAFRSVHAHP